MDRRAVIPVPPPHGRQTRRLTPKFSITDLHAEDGLDRLLLSACGVESAVRWSLGNVLFRHRCGVYGPIPKEDRLLNDYLLSSPDRRSAAHHVVSVHPAGSIWLRISTILGTGQTTLRWSPPPDRADRLNLESGNE
jgi:hypothetical protein